MKEMMISVGLLLLAILAFWYLKGRGRPVQRNIRMTVLCMQCLGIAVCVFDVAEQHFFDDSLERNPPGKGENIYDLTVSGGDFSEKMEVKVEEQELSHQEIKNLFAEAKKEIEESFLGENDSLDHVNQNVVVSDTYQNGLVEADWSFDNSDVIASDGTLRQEGIEQEELVTASVRLYYREYESQYTFSFMVEPPDPDTQEGFLYSVKKALKDQQEISSQDEMLTLPVAAGDYQLQWSVQKANRGMQLVFLGAAAGGAMVFANREEEKRKLRREEEEKRKDYPELISSLSLYIGAGFGVQQAFGQICDMYMEQRREEEIRPGYEQILMTYREMQDGTGQTEALRHLGQRNALPEYRKLSLLLIQNLRRGTRELCLILEREELIAFDMRKMQAQKSGEEASTKLLLPMMGMLVIVLVILMVPAMMTMKL